MVNVLDYIERPVDRQLWEALMKMMETESIDKISTSLLLKEAKVSRTTFYRYYRDKYDLLNQNYQLLLDKTVGKMNDGLSYKSAALTLFRILKSYPVFFKNALSSTEQNNLRSHIHNQCYDSFLFLLSQHGADMNSTYHQLLLEGYITGTMRVISVWAQHDMSESPETIFDLCYQLMPPLIREIFMLYYMQ